MQAIKNKKIYWGLIILFLFFVSCFLGFGAQAQSFGSPADYLKNMAQRPEIDLHKTNLPTMVGSIIFGVLGLLGIIALVLIIYAGINWMIAEGNQENIQQSKQIITYAIMGIIVIALSYAVTYYVVTRVIGATNRSSLEGGPQIEGNLGPSGDIRTGHCYCIEENAAPPDGCMDIPERDNECGVGQYCCVFR